MYEILSDGLGPIKFGMRPSQVKSILGNDLHYEDWMGGNLENFLYYKGLLIGFRGKINDHPTENTSVCMFQIKTVHKLSLWGQEINKATKHDIEYLLKSNNVKYKHLQKHVLKCLNQELQFVFNNDDLLDEVYFANQSS